jgi:DNA (cytosine-5)-methyltransferase 1
MCRIIREVRPRFAFVENVPALTGRGLDRVLGDLADLGYDARWCVLGADDAGAPHHRKRIWLFAYAMQEGRQSTSQQLESHGKMSRDGLSTAGQLLVCEKIWDESVLSSLGLDDGIPTELEPIEAAGNAQVPIVAALAFIILSEGLI